MMNQTMYGTEHGMGWGWGMMVWGGGAWWWFVLIALLIVIPFWRLLPRVGLPAWLAVLAIVPPLALLLLWVVALRQPVERDR